MATVIFSVLALLLFMVFMGIQIAVALGTASFIGVYLLLGDIDIALAVLSGTAYEALRKDIFIVIPLFVLMGEFISRSGAAQDIFSIANRGLRRIPGCLAVATVAGNSVFAAITGVSIASAATFSRIAYPEMVALGYNKSYALGVCCWQRLPRHVDPAKHFDDRLGGSYRNFNWCAFCCWINTGTSACVAFLRLLYCHCDPQS